VYGGIERMLVTLAGIGGGTLNQQFAVPPEGQLWRELRDLGARTAALPPARASRPFSVLSGRRAFTRQLTDLQPDAAVFHGSWTHAMFAPVARERGVVVAFWQHAPIVTPHWPDRWATRTTPDVLIANSRFTADAPAFPAVPRRVIYCPVPPAIPGLASERGVQRAVLGARDTDVVVLMAARLESWKGHRALIEAGRLLGREDLKIWIAGGVQRPDESAYLAQLESQIFEAHLSGSVTLLGHRADVQTLMRAADVYCQPNLAPEPFGLAVAEAMAAQLPCIVSNTGGSAELVDEACGILTDPGDAAAVAAAIARLATEPALRQTMGRLSAERAARMTDPAAKLAELASVLSEVAAHAG
jgi:glycosyltransferase involved in cell wall biosynthesis